MNQKHRLTFKNADRAIFINAVVFTLATVFLARFAISHPSSMAVWFPLLLIPSMLAVFMSANAWNNMMDDLQSIQESYGIPVESAHALPTELNCSANQIDETPFPAGLDIVSPTAENMITSPVFATTPGNIFYEDSFHHHDHDH